LKRRATSNADDLEATRSVDDQFTTAMILKVDPSGGHGVFYRPVHPQVVPENLEDECSAVRNDMDCQYFSKVQTSAELT